MEGVSPEPISGAPRLAVEQFEAMKKARSWAKLTKRESERYVARRFATDGSLPITRLTSASNECPLALVGRLSSC